MKVFITLFFVFLLFYCTPCDKPLLIEKGKISQKVLDYVPYKNENTYALKHSGGHSINFFAKRNSTEEYTECEYCCKYIYKYEVNTTILKPDYPIFDIIIQITGYDSLVNGFSINVGRASFFVNIDAPEPGAKADSLYFEGRYHYNVYKLKADHFPFYDQKGTIYTDSLYYNFQSGVLQIIMSNGEKYTLVE